MAGAVKAAANAAGQDNGGFFTLNEDELTGLQATRGRKVTDSVYLDQVRYAAMNPTLYVKGELKSGEVHAIRITEDRKASWIGPQLRKAAKQLNIDPKDFTVLDRSESKNSAHAPMGFVAYFVKDTSTQETPSE